MELSPAKALELWRATSSEILRRELPDLTQRQLALLLHVYHAPPPHTVRGLAGTLNMSKPAVTRALDRLSILGYLKRKTDEADRRSVLVQRTVAGSVFLRELGDLISGLAREV